MVQHLGVAIVGVFLVCQLGAQAHGDPRPHFPKRFSIDFEETTKLIFSWRTRGTWYYDYPAGAELIYRENGRGDRYCMTIHPFLDTPCVHLVTEGRRYLLFPALGECCMCCTAAAGCGILRQDWLEDAQYQGRVSISGVAAYKWRKQARARRSTARRGQP